VPDDQFQLAGKRDISRVILTFGRMSAKDIFDNNTYANDFFAAGGLGVLAGDGALAYGWEQVLETNYDFQLWNTVHATLDYQFVDHPAFNRDRGPVLVFGARLHWES
jgi:hypothetical protein